MKDWAGKRYWLVGASEGLGAALALRLSRAGAEVILSARNEARLREVASGLPGRTQVEPVDIADPHSVREAAARIGRIEGVVCLAGLYWPMSAQAWDAERVETMCDVNFTGTARVIGAVLPDMVSQGAGHIVITGSLSGFRGLPGAIGYGASKAGVMALAESMHADLRGSGVLVQLANPGFIRTRLTAKNDFRMPFLMEPEAAAEQMFLHMQSDRFKVSFPWLFSLLFRGAQFLPDWAYYRLFAPK